MGAKKAPLGREVWSVAIVVVIGAIGTIFATTSINVVLHTLASELDTEIDTVQWIATGYLLGLAASICTTGWLARRFGARRLYFASLLVFACASALCAAAGTIEQLIAFRVLQGIAGGATMPVGMMMLASVAGSDQMGRVMSIVGVPMILGPIVGPTLAGVLVDQFSWQWAFLMNVPLSLAAFALGVKLLPAMPARPAGPFDTVGFVLTVVGTPLLVYGLAHTGEVGHLGDPVGTTTIVAGAALLIAFVVHARRSSAPLLDVRLWGNPGFAACALTGLLVSAALFGAMLLLPLAFQDVRDASATTAGLLLAPQGVGAAISMAIAGRLSDRLGGGIVAVAGISLVVLGTAPLVLFDAATPDWAIAVTLLVRGLGMGGAIMTAMAAAYVHMTPEQIPDATPQLNVLQRLGGALGSTVLTLALAGALPAGAGAAQTADAYRFAFGWALAIALLALVPAIVLAVLDRRAGPRDGAEVREPAVGAAAA